MNENEIDNMQYSFSENISKIEVKVDSNKDNSKDLINPFEDNSIQDKHEVKKIINDNSNKKEKYINENKNSNLVIVNNMQTILKRNDNLNNFKSSDISSIDNFYNSILKNSRNTITNNNISDTEQLKYDFIKEISKLHPNKNVNFINRMKFDVFKRQNVEKKMNDLIEKTKNKINENIRVKRFNKLFQDANRRIEAEDNLNNLKMKLDEMEIEKNMKKYKQSQWDNIYKERFEKYKKLHDEKIKIESLKKEEEKRKKEEKEIEMCKTIKKPMKNIIEYANKMYEDAKKKNEKKQNTIKYENLIKDNNIKNMSQSPLSKNNSTNKFKISKRIKNIQKSFDNVIVCKNVFSENNLQEKKIENENKEENEYIKNTLRLRNKNKLYKKKRQFEYSNKSMANKIVDDFFFEQIRTLNILFLKVINYFFVSLINLNYFIYFLYKFENIKNGSKFII